MNFMLIKHFHMSCAVISFTLFFLRGIWSFTDSSILRQRWVKIVPHVMDTLLLVSALTLAFTIQQYPFVDGWLTAKFFGLVLYIGLGSIALKHGKTKAMRIFAWLGAQIAFAYIVLVAIRHNPFPFY